MTVRLFSFDIFDTCVTRLCGTPENLYEVLGHRVADKCGALQPTDTHFNHDHLQRLFVAMRRAQDAPLPKVYRHICKTLHLPFSPDELVGLELDTEREMLVPILQTRKLVDSLRGKGAIAYISDMYLPTDFLCEILERNGFFQQGDLLFVSDDIGAWKRDGSLFRHVHQATGTPYGRWHHYGDNLHSDVRVPRRMGIHAHHLSYDPLPYERMWSKMSCPTDTAPSIVAGLSRACRLAVEAPADQAAFVADIAAPIVTLWMSSVLQDAANRGIKKLYFCARDAHPAYRVAQKLAATNPAYKSLQLKYLFTSSKALQTGGALLRRYYMQEGLSSDGRTAFVDSCTRGNSLDWMQKSIMQDDGKPVMAYYLWLTTQNEDWQHDILARYPLHYLFHLSQISADRLSRSAMIAKITDLLEYIMLLNGHSRTAGYIERPGGTIGPLLEGPAPTASLRKTKHHNDTLLETFANGYRLCGLERHTDRLIHTLLFPTLTEFASSPRKVYLRYLTRIGIPGVGHPYVCSLLKKKNRKDRWLFGSIVNSLPAAAGRLWCCLRYTRIGLKIRKHIPLLQ